MLIKGFQGTTLVDYPGKVASTIFVFGCDFHCPFCYNRTLVLEEYRNTEAISEDFVLKNLEARSGFIEGVCITGGEPCMSRGLPEFMEKIKDTGLLVKLDINGSFPSVLSELISKDIVDYIAMDIKAPAERYNELAGADVDIRRINESIQLIKDSKVDYEFRTTVVPLLAEKDIFSIAEWIKGAKRYCLQQFENKKEMLAPAMKSLKPYTREELMKMTEKIRDNFKVCELRS
ncbi:MAG: anaerobic ribonucleoside-triphosphate reductase activating protein [Candidatus Aenigmarchaeota archaeon]|nr:anaerobic ribonucleoside-triphosphate reductase activating protein [Candidatus Aenigmarchaeota archaeon]